MNDIFYILRIANLNFISVGVFGKEFADFVLAAYDAGADHILILKNLHKWRYSQPLQKLFTQLSVSDEGSPVEDAGVEVLDGGVLFAMDFGDDPWWVVII